MKLIVCFDNDSLKKIEINPSDHILLNGYNKHLGDIFQRDVNKQNLDFKDLNFSFTRGYDSFYSNGSIPKIFKDLVKSSQYSFYAFTFRYIFLWINSLDELLQNNTYDEIVLTDFVDSGSYFPYYEAEGEANRQLFYKQWDFLSGLIFKHLVNKGFQKNRIVIFNKRSIFSVYLRIFSRRYLLLGLKLLIHLKSIFFYRDTKKKVSPKFIFLSRSIVHTHYFKKAVESLGIDALIFYGDGLSNVKRNYNYLNNSSLHSLNYLNNVNLFDLGISALRLLKRLFLTLFYRNKVSINGVEINILSYLREVIIYQLEVDLYSISIKKLVKQISRDSTRPVVFCGEMVSQYPFWIKEKLSDTKCYQTQTASLEQMPHPNVFFSDKFLFSNENDLIYFSEQFKIQNLEFWGSLSYSMLPVKVRKNFKRVIFFSQPYELEFQNDIVRELLKLSRKFSFELTIKPHPREKESVQIMKSIFPEINFFDTPSHFNSYIDRYDLALTRTSSIANDLIINGIPTACLLFSELDKQIRINYLKLSNMNIITSQDQLNNLFGDSEKFINDFAKFRTNYLNELGLNKGVKDFVEQVYLDYNFS